MILFVILPKAYGIKKNKLTKGQKLSDSTYRSSLEESDLQRQEADGGGRGGGGDGDSEFHRHRVSVWEGEKVLEMVGGDGCTIM